MNELTNKQKQAIGEVMADNFGSHMQSGWVKRSDIPLAYVAWSNGPLDSTSWAYVDPKGRITYG